MGSLHDVSLPQDYRDQPSRTTAEHQAVVNALVALTHSVDKLRESYESRRSVVPHRPISRVLVAAICAMVGLCALFGASVGVAIGIAHHRIEVVEK